MRFAPLVPRPKPSDASKGKAPRRPVAHGYAVPQASLQSSWIPVSDEPFGFTRAPSTLGIMPKLEVGDVDDPLEREADSEVELDNDEADAELVEAPPVR